MSRLRPVARVAVIEDEAVVYAATLPDGPIVVLDGGAAAIWVEACAGDRSSIADRVAEATGVPVGEIRAAVHAFVDELVARGLLAADPE
jgi:hypothetical protein